MNSPSPSRRALHALALVGTALAFSAVVSACNTVEGVGKDTRDAGRAIERSAQ
jgi:predicted small secreted protein